MHDNPHLGIFTTISAVAGGLGKILISKALLLYWIWKRNSKKKNHPEEGCVHVLHCSEKGLSRKRVDPLERCFNIDMTFFKPSTYKHRLPTIE